MFFLICAVLLKKELQEFLAKLAFYSSVTNSRLGKILLHLRQIYREIDFSVIPRLSLWQING
jgi:hypothetical protein